MEKYLKNKRITINSYGNYVLEVRFFFIWFNCVWNKHERSLDYFYASTEEELLKQYEDSRKSKEKSIVRYFND